MSKRRPISGAPLGSVEDRECQIDSIAQSWAILSGAANGSTELAEVRACAAQAMDAVADRLVRLDDQLILLFTPPFDKTPHDPGYIKGYLPGSDCSTPEPGRDAGDVGWRAPAWGGDSTARRRSAARGARPDGVKVTGFSTASRRMRVAEE